MNQMTLYEIDKMILGCIKVSDSEYVDTETGEVIDIDYLNHLEMERDEKISNIIKFYLNLKSESESLEAEGQEIHTQDPLPRMDQRRFQHQGQRSGICR